MSMVPIDIATKMSPRAGCEHMTTNRTHIEVADPSLTDLVEVFICSECMTRAETMSEGQIELYEIKNELH